MGQNSDNLTTGKIAKTSIFIIKITSRNMYVFEIREKLSNI